MIWIIANPKAGNGKARQRAKEAIQYVRDRNEAVQLHYTNSPGDAYVIAKCAVTTGIKKIIICGGDGTIHEILPALRNTNTTLAILPFGSCNDFARYLGIPKSMNKAIDCCLNGKVVELDLGICNNCLFASVAAIGFDAEVNIYVEKTRKRKRKITYLYEALKLLREYNAKEITLHGDFGIINVTAMIVACANTGSYGGGLKIAPHALANDGLFDICIISPLSTLQALNLFHQIFRGNHVNHPSVRIEKSSFLTIESDSKTRYCLDGEYGGVLPVRFAIAPHAINVTVPI
jgi:diacylglycerol kinase (ATP)